MGQRHQIYLIARIIPHRQPLGKYRCVGAFHHQCCYGREPLKAATRFMTLIKQKENAQVCREEIRSIHGLYGRFGTTPKLPAVPCPFTLFLMHSAWTSDLSVPEEFYESGGNILPASMGTREGDNNDGITVIDVTDPESPAYCFVSLHGLDFAEKPSSVSVMTPLSAKQYLRSYYPEPRTMSDYGQCEEQSVLATLRPFESLPIITIDMLAEAWPGEYKPSGLSLLEPKESSTTSVHMLPSLVDLTFVPAIDHALQTGETDLLDPFLWLPGNVSKIKETLRVRNSLSATDFALLSKIIPVEVKRSKTIDLSHFSLTGEQVIELLSSQKGVDILDLSHMPQITTDTLRKVIPILPNLRRLVMLHTLSDADVLSLLSESPELFYHIESFIHLVFLRPLGQAAFPASFSHIESTDYSISIASLPYFTIDQLLQGLTDYLSLFTAGDSYKTSVSMRDELPLLAAYASAVREPGRSWSERIVPFIPGNNFNQHEGWFFAWSVRGLRDSSDLLYRYAFAKINKEVMEECRRRIDELVFFPNHPDKPQEPEGQASDAKLEDSSGVKASLSDEELRIKETAIRSEYADRQFHIFDAESFFQELVKEGRPAPSPDALTKLLELFAILEKINSRPRLTIMTQADLRSFLEVARYDSEIRFSLARLVRWN